MARILDALDAAFLERTQCYFGGGTRIVLALGEYRESADIDFLCANRDGYRELRSTIAARSLGAIAARHLELARDVVADRYGIRTFVKADAEKIKFEIVNEARVELSGARAPGLPVACLDEVSCFAEKLLANDDRWGDESFLSRDVIDLAYMIEGWGREPLLEGAQAAERAYGDSVRTTARAAAAKLLESKPYLKKCTETLRLSRTATMVAGLKRLAAKRW